MTKIPARTLDFFDRHVIGQITEKYGFAEKDAIRKFLESDFFIYLIERYAENKHTTAQNVLKPWDCLNLTDFIYDMYDMYHTECLQNAFNDIDELILEKQSKVP